MKTVSAWRLSPSPIYPKPNIGLKTKSLKTLNITLMCQVWNSGAPDFSFSQQQCHDLALQELPTELKAAVKIFRHCMHHP